MIWLPGAWPGMPGPALTPQSSPLCVIALRDASGPVGLSGGSLAFRPSESWPSGEGPRTFRQAGRREPTHNTVASEACLTTDYAGTIKLVVLLQTPAVMRTTGLGCE